MLRTGLAVLTLFLFAGPSPAVIVSVTHYAVDFTKPDEAKSKATWSDPDKFQVTPQGLGSSTGHGARRFWLQTTEPIGLGVSWRPTMAADLRVTVKGPPSNGQCYARYSADGQHWTTWQPLEADPTPALAETSKGPAQTFKGVLRVPYREHEKYGALLSAYSRRDVPWVSDEEAAVKDIVKTDPKFFERQTPFVGYVQFLYEADLPADQRIQGLAIEAYWSVGGLHAIPKDPAVSKDRDGPWRFRAGR